MSSVPRGVGSIRSKPIPIDEKAGNQEPLATSSAPSPSPTPSECKSEEPNSKKSKLTQEVWQHFTKKII